MTVAVNDNDSPGIAVSPHNGVTTEKGDSFNLTVMLQTQPTAVVALTGADTATATFVAPSSATSLGFTLTVSDRLATSAPAPLNVNVALQAVRQGARLIATNPDRTCPVEGGEIPDCAGMIAAVEAVTDRKVEAIVGKPSPIILGVALAALGVPARDAAIVGDRIETDIVMGRRLGLGTVLVLSGITHADDPRIAAIAPDHVVRSVRDLVE